jgi:hypothetical protein
MRNLAATLVGKYLISGKLNIVKGFYIIVIALVAGCQSNPTATSVGAISKCPDKPVGSLEGKNVKVISLNTQGIKESGIVRVENSVGFSFDAKSGQQFSYRTEDNICVWVYSPDNKLLTNSNIPQSGKYIVQISTLKGQATFNLAMQLSSTEPIQVVQSQEQISVPPKISQSVTSPEQAVRDYYTGINNRDYRVTWALLSQEYRNKKSISYSDYTDWWNSVRIVKINSINLHNRSNERAYVDAELVYAMNNGRVKGHDVRFSLIWKQEINSWFIFDVETI